MKLLVGDEALHVHTALQNVHVGGFPDFRSKLSGYLWLD